MIMGIERWGDSQNRSIYWGILTSEDNPYGKMNVTIQVNDKIKELDLKDIVASKNKLVGRMDLQDVDPSSDEDTDIQDAFELNFSVQKISYGEFSENSKQLGDTGIDSEYQSQPYENVQDSNDFSKAGLYKSGFKCNITPAVVLPSTFSPKQTSHEDFNKIIASNDEANGGLVYLVDGKIKIVWSNPKRTYVETYDINDFYKLSNVGLANIKNYINVVDNEEIYYLSNFCIEGLPENDVLTCYDEEYSSLDASASIKIVYTKIKDISDLIYYTIEDLKEISTEY